MRAEWGGCQPFFFVRGCRVRTRSGEGVVRVADRELMFDEMELVRDIEVEALLEAT